MKFYLNETKQVLSGKDTTVVAKEMGLSHSTVSLRVRKTLDALKVYFDIPDTLFNGTDVRVARGNAEYWIGVIRDYEKDVKPKSDGAEDAKFYMMVQTVAGAYIKVSGLPDDNAIENIKSVARRLL